MSQKWLQKEKQAGMPVSHGVDIRQGNFVPGEILLSK